MKRIAFAVSALLALASCAPAFAQTAKTSLNLSSAITAGGTFQVVFTADITRKGCLIENPTTATEVLYVNFGSASPSASNSFSLAPGQSIACSSPSVILTDTVEVMGATTGHGFIATVQ